MRIAISRRGKSFTCRWLLRYSCCNFSRLHAIRTLHSPADELNVSPIRTMLTEAFHHSHGGPQQPKRRKHTNPIFSAMREDLLTRLCMSGSFGGGIGGIIKKIQNILISMRYQAWWGWLRESRMGCSYTKLGPLCARSRPHRHRTRTISPPRPLGPLPALSVACLVM